MWIRFTQRSDVLSSLRQLNRSLIDTQADPTAWKWALISLFSALQGAAVCNLSGSVQIGALTQKSANQTYASLTSGNLSGRFKERLADPATLIFRLSGAEKRLEEAGPNISISASQLKSFQLLQSLRNQFAHYSPMMWSIEKAGLPQLGLDLLSIIKDVFEDGWSFMHSDVEERQEISDLLFQAETFFSHTSSQTDQ